MVELRGHRELVGKLKRNANLNDVKNIVRLNGSEMQRNAQRKAPVDTGHLRRSITLRYQDSGFTAKVKSEAEYAPYVEYGTRYMSAQPHVRPAFHEQKRKFINDLKRITE